MKSRFSYKDAILTALSILLLSLIFYTSVTGAHLIAVVEGHSMEPTLNTGDIVFIIPVSDPREIHVGDVIVFRRPSGEMIIHRVISIIISGDKYYYVTKGDNNLVPDPPNRIGEPGIEFGDVVGKILSIGDGRVFKIPYIGLLPLVILRSLYMLTMLRI
ncbi:MAG: signal peptidase I [Sulfolobales archaeon]